MTQPTLTHAKIIPILNMDLSSWPLSTLQSMADKKAEAYMNLVNATPPVATAISKAKDTMEEFFAEIKKRETVPQVKIEATGSTTSADMRTMENFFKDSVSKFKPGDNVSDFILELENCFQVCVTKANGLEESFCRHVANKLSREYVNGYLTLPEPSRKSWTLVKKHLKESYATKETVYQTLAHLWDMERNDGEDIHSYGIRCEEKGQEICQRIEQIYNDKKSITATTESSQAWADCFHIISSMHLVQHVRLMQPDIYRLLVRDIDSEFKPTEISIRAKSYVDKIGETDKAATGTFNAYKMKQTKVKSKAEKAKEDCFSWKKRKGKCFRGENCPYKHDPKYKKVDKPKKDEKPEAKPSSGRTYASGPDQFDLMSNEMREKSVFLES